MFSQFLSAKGAAIASILVLSSALCQAADMSINFRGAIVEPVCEVSSQNISYTAADVQRARQSKTTVKAPLELNMACHAAQAVQVSFEQGGRESRAGFGTGIDGVSMTMSRNGRALPPGKPIAVALPARKVLQLKLDTQLNNTAAAGADNSASDKVNSRILVSLNYH